ncbi:hypothetical protein FACS1894137_19840 [Spirochaetia bacterium]|nr:hypothetical protein FACS1894137_19840 [Spirochaetia bacterium]
MQPVACSETRGPRNSIFRRKNHEKYETHEKKGEEEYVEALVGGAGEARIV